MKWLAKKFDDCWNYSLKVNDNLVFQIEPLADGGYVIWLAAVGWFHEFAEVKKLKAAKQICNEIAAVVEKYKGELNHGVD